MVLRAAALVDLFLIRSAQGQAAATAGALLAPESKFISEKGLGNGVHSLLLPHFHPKSRGVQPEKALSSGAVLPGRGKG